MQGGRPPQPSGTNRPSSSACPSHGRSRGTRRLRALCGPQGTVEGGTPEAERPQTASGHGRGGTPGPIPNPEVKPPSADCTAGPARGRPGRRWPTGGVFATGGAPRRARGPSFFVQAYLLICLGRTPSVGFGPFFVIRPLVACVRCLMGPQINCRRSEYLSSCLRDRRIFYLVSIPARPPPGCLLRHGARGRLSPVV